MAPSYVSPLQYNSQCITFPEWVSLFTLCFAPLVAHVVSGIPQISYLAQNRPKWYDYLCHYNPTSILWRYAAITDRRIRATRWSCESLAASNAILWTGKGWDGGEDMIIAADPYCLQYPESTHVRLFSVTVLKTMITTLQGISTAYSLIARLAGIRVINFYWGLGLDQVFMPLAVLGLLRLFPAAWLTEDFTYASVPEKSSKSFRSSSLSQAMLELNSSHDSLDPFLMAPPHLGVRFKSPRSSRPSMVFRILYILILGGLLALSLLHISPTPENSFTPTSFVTGLFYSVLLTISIALYTYYFFHSQTTTTLLPCISTTWYRIYTLLVIVWMIVIVVIASIETNKSPGGSYTSYIIVDAVRCSQNTSWWFFYPYSDFIGIVSIMKRNQTGAKHSPVAITKLSDHNVSLEDAFWLYKFTGYCMGNYD